MSEHFDPSWASGAIQDDPVETIRTFERGLTVRLIAIPRHELKTCAVDDSLAGVVERYRSDQFDFLPVTSSENAGIGRPDRIVGIIGLVPFLKQKVDQEGLVGQHMRPLSEENLIGADASILAFVRDADQQTCRLVIAGREISGLVTLSDLQRLPVRAALFAMVTHLEILMMHVVRHECGGHDEGWLERLSRNRQQRVRQQVFRARQDDSFVDKLLFTQFSDKVTILRKGSRIGSDKDQFQSELKRVQVLRNALAHANDYAVSRDDAGGVCKTVRDMDKWIKRFARILSEKGGSA